MARNASIRDSYTQRHPPFVSPDFEGEIYDRSAYIQPSPPLQKKNKALNKIRSSYTLED